MKTEPNVEVWHDDESDCWGIQCWDCGLDVEVSTESAPAFREQENHVCVREDTP